MIIKRFNESITAPYKKYIIVESEDNDYFICYEFLKIFDNTATLILRLVLYIDTSELIKNKDLTDSLKLKEIDLNEEKFDIDFDTINSLSTDQADTLEDAENIMRLLASAKKYNL